MGKVEEEDERRALFAAPKSSCTLFLLYFHGACVLLRLPRIAEQLRRWLQRRAALHVFVCAMSPSLSILCS